MNERASGTARSKTGEVWEFDASWYFADNQAVWDAVLRHQGKIKGMTGGRVLVDGAISDSAGRIEAFVRDAVAHEIGLKD